MIGSDPVQLGLVASFNRPGGNLTGFAYLNAEIAPKRLELLHDLIPAIKSIALLVNPAIHRWRPRKRKTCRVRRMPLACA
jgi:putative ABC transport system substrate-binding protein